MRLIPIQLALLLALGSAVAQAAWPEIAFPRGARVEAIGDQVRLNGVPMQMHRVLSSQSPRELINFYREALGTRHAEQGLPGSHILSQELGDFFITINIRPLSAKVTEVLVSVSDRIEAKRAANRPLGFGLPANSTVMSDMESVDAGKRSRQLVVGNRHGIDTNVQALTQELASRGFEPDGAPSRHGQTEHVQLFKGEQRDAQLTLVRKGGETQIVLTTIQYP
ncbi:hypothetical protein [Rhodoferax ferrireducens]|uniref:hypothetical protein n=1 Tax=Rhodoferax ferrireducens TaxID=192843 RepID=UPI0013008D27|nr:hypothetical protein [Rhodoferax ferrireducens]